MLFKFGVGEAVAGEGEARTLSSRSQCEI